MFLSEVFFKLLKEQLWFRIFIAMVMGGAVGVLLPDLAVHFEPLGIIFMKMIRMLIVPLVFFSISAAIVSMQDVSSLGRKGVNCFVLYLVTTAFAIIIGLVIGHYMEPGKGVDFSFASSEYSQEPNIHWESTLIGIVPSNIFDAFSTANILQVIIISILVACAIRLSGDKGKVVGRFICSAGDVMYSMTFIVMRFAPYGVFGLMSWFVASQDSEILYGLFAVVGAVYFACAVHIVLIYTLFVKLFTGLNPIYFLSKVIPAQIMAYTTTSSSASLPMTMEVTERKLGVSKSTASFTLPLGTTINMDGTALYQGVCVMFVTQALGIDLSLQQYAVVIFTSTLASIGTAGVPGAGLIMLSLVLSSVGLPLEAVALIAGIDRLLDMIRTVVNVTGDAMVAVVVDSIEGKLDKELYYSRRDF